MTRFYTGDIVKSSEYYTHFLKQNTEYTVSGYKGNNVLIDMGKQGINDYPEDWFELVTSAKIEYPINNVGISYEFDPKILYQEEIHVSSEGQTDLKSSYVMKSWSHFFQAIKAGKKRHDLRKIEQDRNFRVGEVITLLEYDNINGKYTGESLQVQITYITSRDTPCAFSSAVLDDNYAILSFELVG